MSPTRILGPRKGKVDFYVRDPMLGSSMEFWKAKSTRPPSRSTCLNAKPPVKDIGATVLICDIEGAEVGSDPSMDLTGLRAAIIETHPQWIGPEGIKKCSALSWMRG